MREIERIISDMARISGAEIIVAAKVTNSLPRTAEVVHPKSVDRGVREAVQYLLEAGSSNFDSIEDLGSKSVPRPLGARDIRYTVTLACRTDEVIWLGYGKGAPPTRIEVDRMKRCITLHRAAIPHSVSEEMDDDSEAKRIRAGLFGLAHDMRAPLQNLRNTLALLESGDREQSVVASAFGACDDLESLVNQLLIFGNVVGAGSAGAITEIPGDDLLDSLARQFQATAAAKGIELRYEPPGAPLSFLAPETSLRRIVSNLIGNALKFTPSGAVAISLVRSGPDRAVIAVKDTGPGISLMEQEQLFKPFIRFRTDVPGLGLGLSVTKQLVENLGGAIRCRSAPGRGATFEVELPCVDSRPVAGGRYIIAIVDDDANCRESTGRLLRRAGHTVHEAGSVEELETLLQHHLIDKVLTDAHLDEESWVQVLDLVRSCGKSISIAVMSGDVTDERSYAFAARGVQEVFEKPVDGDCLRNWAQL